MAKVGRPSKYDNIDLKQVVVAGELGFTDLELCRLFDIKKSTLNKYKKQYPEFMDSLTEGKNVADEKVIRALYKRATGYSHPDTHIATYQGTVNMTPIIKHYPPDTTACIYWLRNRQQWIDKIEPNTFDSDIDIPKDIDSLSPKEIDEYYDNLRK